MTHPAVAMDRHSQISPLAYWLNIICDFLRAFDFSGVACVCRQKPGGAQEAQLWCRNVYGITMARDLGQIHGETPRRSFRAAPDWGWLSWSSNITVLRRYLASYILCLSHWNRMSAQSCRERYKRPLSSQGHGSPKKFKNRGWQKGLLEKRLGTVDRFWRQDRAHISSAECLKIFRGQLSQEEMLVWRGPGRLAHVWPIHMRWLSSDNPSAFTQTQVNSCSSRDTSAKPQNYITQVPHKVKFQLLKGAQRWFTWARVTSRG